MPRVFKDYYSILGVSHHADLKTIRTAYRKLARQYHPDLNPSPEATRMMQDINEAYQVLSDPDQRRMYDLWVAGVRSSRPHPYSADAQRRNAEAEYWRWATQDYQRQAAARRAAEEQRRREQAQAEERRRKTADQRAKEQAEATLRRIEEERRKREAAEEEEEAREQRQREQAEEILRRIEAERLKREQVEAAQDYTDEQRQKEEAEAVLRKIEEEQRRRKEARARQEAAAKRERERAQESLNRIEAERIRRERVEAAQNDERRQQEEAEAVLRKIDAQRRRREAAEAEQEAREERQYEQAVVTLRRIEEERLSRKRVEAAQDGADERRRKEEAEAVLRKIEEERRRRKEAMASQEAAERAERKRAQEILDQIERERLRRDAANRRQAAKRSRTAANPLWKRITKLHLSTRQATVLLATVVGIIAIVFIPTLSDLPAAVLRHPQAEAANVADIEWSPDGSMLAASFTYDANSDVVIWDAKSYKLLQVLADRGPSIAWLPDGQKLAFTSTIAEVMVWDIQAGTEVSSIGDTPIIVTDRSGVRVPSSSPDTITFSPSSPVVDLASSPDGSILAVVYGDPSILLWSYEAETASDSNVKGVIANTSQDIDQITWSSDGTTLAACNDEGLLTWRWQTSVPLGGSHWGDRLAQYSPDGHTLACAYGENIILEDTDPHTSPWLGPQTGLDDFMWSPDGDFVASCGQNKVMIWNISNCSATGECKPVQVIDTYPSAEVITAVAWSPDGNWLASGSRDGVKIWEPHIDE